MNAWEVAVLNGRLFLHSVLLIRQSCSSCLKHPMSSTGLALTALDYLPHLAVLLCLFTGLITKGSSGRR